ncbi:receptor-type tyrosine-protein phosphatase alpha-like [Physella acuta]|uniref:receptor-type tyrosine-protein phosphatase alpha-like n=1 Tax=Physella acuta TaxID=109671 RepID=UPI0027DC0B61|nr:receptor-type tyrosine-protein phosphatase alpha-like [Physella acuta]
MHFAGNVTCDSYNGKVVLSLTECTNFTYGKDCCENCSMHFAGNVTCDSYNGKVVLSLTECTNFTYGKDCCENCSMHFAGNVTCDSYNGTCLEGCKLGYTGNLCNTSCDVGYNGSNCEFNCSSWCVKNTTKIWCNTTDGLRLIVCRDGFNSTALNCWSFFNTNTSGPISPTSDDNLAVIIAPVAVIVVVALALFVGIFIWRQRRLKKRKTTELPFEIRYTPTQETPNRSTHKPVAVIAAYCNDTPDSDDRFIQVPKLNDYMQTHNREFFIEEFKKIPPPQNVTMLDGQSEENKHKNRYKNICAYDHSRVHLEINTRKNEGDYINASYIEGYNNEEKFIASQGPNDVVVNDFVRMLWEQKVDKVVMLTNLIEEGMVKSVKYWSDKGKATFGDIKVELLSIDVFADYTIRKMELKKKNKPTHHFNQFHFTSWPDKGVPLTPWGLVDFEQRVALGSTSRPIVVHCRFT